MERTRDSARQAHCPSQGEARAQEIRTGLAWLQAADPVLARVIDDHPDFDPDAWARRLPAMGLFGWPTSRCPGGRTGASPPACYWPPRDRADSVRIGNHWSDHDHESLMHLCDTDPSL
jgi:hypothetical protein